MLWFVLEQHGELDELFRASGNSRIVGNIDSCCSVANIVYCCMCEQGSGMNINDRVRVVLTADGASTYNCWYAHHVARGVKQEGDVVIDSLWSIMRVFGGDRIGLGMRSPFFECQMEIV